MAATQDGLGDLRKTLKILADDGKSHTYRDLAEAVGLAMTKVDKASALGIQLERIKPKADYGWLFGVASDDCCDNEVSNETIRQAVHLIDEAIAKAIQRQGRNKTRNYRRSKQRKKHLQLKKNPHENTISKAYGSAKSESESGSDTESRPRSRSATEISELLEQLTEAVHNNSDAVAQLRTESSLDLDLAEAQKKMAVQELKIEELQKKLKDQQLAFNSLSKLSQICFEGLPDGYGLGSPGTEAVKSFESVSDNVGTKIPHQASGWVYILWDIENIAIPRSIGNIKQGMANGSYRVVNSIRDFLKKKGVLSTSSREFFKLFFRPNNSSIPVTSLRDLQRAGVDLVATVSEKQEAADRLIEHEIKRICRALTEAHSDVLKLQRRLDHVGGQLQQLASGNVSELPVHVYEGGGISELKAQKSTIVLISSDLDFLKPMEMAYQCGFRVVIIHDEVLDGERKEAYMRHCHAKMFMWHNVLGRLYQEAETERQEQLNKKAQPFDFEKLDDDALVPVQRVLENFAEINPQSTRITRHQLAELLNIELGRRLQEDTKAIDTVLGHYQQYFGSRQDLDVSGLSEVNILEDDGARTLLPSSNIKSLKHFIRRVEKSSNIITSDENDGKYLNFDRSFLMSPPRLSQPARIPLTPSANQPVRRAVSMDSFPTTPRTVEARVRPSRTISRSSIMVDDHEIDFNVFGLMSAESGSVTPPDDKRQGVFSPDAPEWATLQAPGAQKAGCTLTEWNSGCSAKIIGTLTVRPPSQAEYTAYIVQVNGLSQSYQIERRYSEFAELREALSKCNLAEPLTPMPTKRLFNMAPSTIDERMKYFNRLLKQCEGLDEAECGPLLQFLTDY